MSKKNKPVIIDIKPENVNDLKNKVYTIRGVQVMLDYDLAEIYGYEVKRLNEQVKRNINRFPSDFMFQISKNDLAISKKGLFNLRSQIATSKNKKEVDVLRGGRQYLPYAFTEQGIYMLATVLKGELAEKQSIFIMRAFKEMRHIIQQNIQFVTKNEFKLIADSHETRFTKIEKDIDMINKNFVTDVDRKYFVIYKGQKFEADKAYIDIYQDAKQTIFLIDDYVNTKTLELVSHKKKNVDVTIFTDNKGKRNGGYLTKSEIDDFNEEFPNVEIKPNGECHDRFIITDYDTKYEKVYICGASSKDAGNRVCTINLLETNEMIHPVVEKLLKQA